jgi:LmbE family N-acetylglucosaminyl deacetylase
MVSALAALSASRARIEFDAGSATLHQGRLTRPVCSCLIVAAHPDDEVIGAGARFKHLGRLAMVHVTDGAPRNMVDANRCGFPSREAYARERRDELVGALATAGVKPLMIELGIADQEASANIAQVARCIADTIGELEPDLVLTHPYEGGHPDHDATAAAVHAAVGLGASAPVFEFTSYHAVNGQFRAHEFLGPRDAITTVELTATEQQCKRSMLDCFRTQQETLAVFGSSVERYRPAPQYDFGRPPHSGTLNYERFDWGMTPKRFAELAASAFKQLGLGGLS